MRHRRPWIFCGREREGGGRRAGVAALGRGPAGVEVRVAPRPDALGGIIAEVDGQGAQHRARPARADRADRRAQAPLEARLDDTMPGDVIGRLEGTIWSLQSLVLRHYLTLPETEARLHLVAQACGQKVARNDWSGFAQTGEPSLRRLVLTLAGTPFANPYLVVRATRSEACIELLQCAHRSAYPEVRDLADSLCVLHGQWLRGFAHGIHPRVEIQSTREHERCRQNWWLGAGRLS